MSCIQYSCLDDAHGGLVGPVKAGRGELELDFLLAKLDRLQPCIDQHLDARWHSGGKAEIVGCGHAVDDGASLVATGDRPDNGSIVGYCRAAGQLVLAWLVIKTAVDSAELACCGKALQSLVDCGPAAKIGKITGRPDFTRLRGDPSEELGAEVSILP